MGNILTKLGVRSRLAAVLLALRHGVVALDPVRDGGLPHTG